MNRYYTHTVCLECGNELPNDPMLRACNICGSNWLDARYDYAGVAQAWREGALRDRDYSLWRYTELLPFDAPDMEITMGEGYTPLLRLHQYQRMFDHSSIFVKDERHNPTNSFKDRQAAVAVTAMKRAGIGECVLASTGNAAVAYAAYCARAGIKLWIFMTSLVPPEKLRECALYGAEVVKVSGTYDEAKEVAAEFAKHRGIALDRGAKAIPGKESMKTMAYEMAEQLGLALNPDRQGWRAPDWYVQAVSGGIGPLGVWKGFSELLEMGLIDKMPKLAIVQSAGCAPMVQAFHNGAPKATPVIPKTLVHVLATGDPGLSYVLLNRAVTSNGGTMIAIEDGEAFEAMKRLASRGGLSVEPATAVAFAGLERLLTDGTIQRDETVIINCSGHTFPVESHILSDQYILELNNTQNTADGARLASKRSEGLGAALQNLDEQVTTILVVDDTANDRRLIRRLLQRYKRYRIVEAHDGAEGLRMATEIKPDLIISDLTMPNMDGFTLLETLKHTPGLEQTPVVVISAKSLSEEDRRTLEEYSESVWVKGGFDTHALVDHVVGRLGHTPIEHTSRSEKRATDTLPNSAAKVLVIDDNPKDVRLLQRLFKSAEGANYQLIETNTGRDGLKAVYQHHPDLIVLDLLLPDMDGEAIAQTLYNDETLREIPIIIMSAKPIDPQQRAALLPNIHAVIEKSLLDRKEFLSIVDGKLK
jgi:threonine synthase